MSDSTLLPPRNGIHYLDHQIEGIRWMMARENPAAPVCRGGILGDDMGLGKTFQTIGLLKNSPLTLRTLIVCPPALVAGWLEELRACGYVPRTLMAGSSEWIPVQEADIEKTSVWLTTYPKVCMYRKPMARTAFERIILDEGHVIRNGKDTSRWMSAMAVAKAATCRWILSATPVQNGYHDWRNLCWWLRVRCPSAEIPDLGTVVMLRRTMDELRDQIAALPPPPRFVIHDLNIPETGNTAAECRLFRALCDQLQSAMESRTVSALMKLELYMRIQQFLVHPQIYIESMRYKFRLGSDSDGSQSVVPSRQGRGFRSAYPRPDWTGTATKWSAVMEEMRAGVAAGEGTIVFCNFRAEMDRVEETAKATGAAVFCIRGGMGVEKVGGAVNGAREAAGEGKAVVVVVQIVSGGAGLNLQFCRRVLFLSQHWNPAVVHQAVGRAVRIGQSAVVEVHLFRIVDDVLDNLDRRMVQVHRGKIDRAQEICETLYEGFPPLVEIPGGEQREHDDGRDSSNQGERQGADDEGDRADGPTEDDPLPV